MVGGRVVGREEGKPGGRITGGKGGKVGGKIVGGEVGKQGGRHQEKQSCREESTKRDNKVRKKGERQGGR